MRLRPVNVFKMAVRQLDDKPLLWLMVGCLEGVSSTFFDFKRLLLKMAIYISTYFLVLDVLWVKL